MSQLESVSVWLAEGYLHIDGVDVAGWSNGSSSGRVVRGQV